jgi:hypothetical protein
MAEIVFFYNIEGLLEGSVGHLFKRNPPGAEMKVVLKYLDYLLAD